MEEEGLELVAYIRSSYCPYVALARDVLTRYKVPCREIDISGNPEAQARVVSWTGFKSVPTLLVARAGQDVPYEEPAPLEPGVSPRNVNRGSMITEPDNKGLEDWLFQHGFIEHPYRR